jgi:hypothetical protein
MKTRQKSIIEQAAAGATVGARDRRLVGIPDLCLLGLGRDFGVVGLLLTLLLSATSTAFCGSTAKAGSWAVSLRTGLRDRDGNDKSWSHYTRPTSAAGAQIEWERGAYRYDSVKVGTVETKEYKFASATNGADLTVDSRVWTGFSDRNPNPRGDGSSTYGGGAGCGIYDPQRWWPYQAGWTNYASGTLGPQKGAYYSSYAAGDDPWPIFPDDLANIQGSKMDVYIPLSILGGWSAGTGTNSAGSNYASGFFYEVEYDTASATNELLYVEMSGYQVVEASSPVSSPDLHLYLMNGEDAPPTTQSTNEITLSQLQSMLSQQLSSGAAITTPIYIGVFLGGVPVPTVKMADGSVASAGVTAGAYDSNVASPTGGNSPPNGGGAASGGSPTLNISASGNVVTVSWPAIYLNYNLQTTYQLQDPTSWYTLTNTPAFDGSNFVVTNSMDSEEQFFRLQEQ